MKNNLSKFAERWNILRFTELILLIAVVVGYGEYRLYQTNQKLAENTQHTASSTDALDSRVLELYSLLTQISTQSASLNETIQNELSKSATFAEQLGKVNDAVGTLDQLSKTDPKLLEKYSKIYFLNENYTPAELATLPNEYVYNKNTTYQFHFKAYPFLEKMMKAAQAEGKQLLIISSYRSFGTQSALKTSYKITYGAGTANKFSADQGYSEHQLGTTLDFTTAKTGDNFNAFDSTAEFTWLVNNAHKYGFILSYPKNNKFYVYEPWHWRFVGVDLATRLHAEGKNFYDLDQRDINNYLLLIFK